MSAIYLANKDYYNHLRVGQKQIARSSAVHYTTGV